MKQWFVPYALNINTFQSAKTIKFKQLKPMYPVNELRLKSPYKNLEKSLSMLNEAATSKLRLQLSNTHYVAKSRRPYTDYVQPCNKDRANRQLDIGNTYITEKYCRYF